MLALAVIGSLRGDWLSRRAHEERVSDLRDRIVALEGQITRLEAERDRVAATLREERDWLNRRLLESLGREREVYDQLRVPRPPEVAPAAWTPDRDDRDGRRPVRRAPERRPE